jgi:hypothetical protein
MDAAGCRLSNELRLAAGLPLHPLNGQEGRQNEPSLAGHKKEEQRRVVMAYWRWRTVGQGGGVRTRRLGLLIGAVGQGFGREPDRDGRCRWGMRTSPRRPMSTQSAVEGQVPR